MTIELKIKLKTLAYEAKEIRKYETRLFKAGNRLHNENLSYKAASLHSHRVEIVRRAARNTHIAYGYLRGRTYDQLEKGAQVPPNWKEVYRMVTQYGPYSRDRKLDFLKWANIESTAI